jgi:hypothetical protein
MKWNKSPHKGSMMVISIGLMIIVSLLTSTQLESLRLNFDAYRNMDYQEQADRAGRSGIEYGYSMLKNIMEANSMIGLRFATHMHGNANTKGWTDGATDTGLKVAEIPPFWKEVLDPAFDKRAFTDGQNPEKAGRFVGTDSYALDASTVVPNTDAINPGYITADLNDPPFPIDKKYADRNPEFLLGFQAEPQPLKNSLRRFDNSGPTFYVPALDAPPGTIGEHVPDASIHQISDLSECPVETLRNVTGGVLDGTRYLNFFRTGTNGGEITNSAICEIYRWSVDAGSSPNVYAADANEADSYLQGHFGDKRWHYFSHWDYSDATIGGYTSSDADWDAIASGTKTGSNVLLKPSGLDPFVTGSDVDFTTYYLDFFNRLTNYSYYDDDGSTLKSQYPHEPGDYATAGVYNDACKDCYHVQIFNSIDLDMDMAEVGVDNLVNPNDYMNSQYRTFFKLWIIRDMKKDNYGRSTSPTHEVTSLILTEDVKLRDWEGNTIVYPPSDLHPIWMSSNTGTIQLHETNNNRLGYTPGGAVTLSRTYTSYAKRNWLYDWYDHDGDTEANELLGVLQWPAPYLAYQRGDHDYWSDAQRSTVETTRVPQFHPHYTKFTLFSLGTVRVLTDAFSGSTIVSPENQKISDMTVIAKSLYKMDFYIDIRGVDIGDDDMIAFPIGSTLTNPNEGYDYTTPASNCDANGQNEMNWAHFTSRFVPICDINAPGSNIAGSNLNRKLTEPIGIYTSGIEKVAYSESKI